MKTTNRNAKLAAYSFNLFIVAMALAVAEDLYTAALLGGLLLSVIVSALFDVLLVSYKSCEPGSFNYKIVCGLASERLISRILEPARIDDLSALVEAKENNNQEDIRRYKLRLQFHPYWVLIATVADQIGSIVRKVISK
jgi:hypothetical protein